MQDYKSKMADITMPKPTKTSLVVQQVKGYPLDAKQFYVLAPPHSIHFVTDRH